MLLSELIKDLQDQYNQHGDIFIEVDNFSHTGLTIKKVDFDDANKKVYIEVR